GQRELARQRYDTALYTLRGDSGQAAAAVLRRVARSYIDEGLLEPALDCLAAALASSEAQRDSTGVAHALNLTAILNGQRGKLDLAEHLYARASRFAAE